MTCKDCVYEPKCMDLTNEYFDIKLATSENVENDCPDFQDKDEYQKITHAHWIKVSDYPEYECSNCHFPAAKNDYGYYAICDVYCRACGAKMDWEED